MECKVGDYNVDDAVRRLAMWGLITRVNNTWRLTAEGVRAL